MAETIAKSKRSGTVNPDLLYTSEALREECRMKRQSIVEMRQRGGVKPAQVGSQLYYDGAEVKAWILKQKRK